MSIAASSILCRWVGSVAAVALAFQLGGCVVHSRRPQHVPKQVEPAQQKPMDLSEVKQLKLTVPDSGLCPGDTVQLTVTAVLSDGTEKELTGDGELQVSSPQGTYVHGQLMLSDDITLSLKSGFKVRATLASKPEIAAEESYPPSYQCMKSLTLIGKEGASGEPGRDGAGGAAGGPGGDGPQVTAEVAYIKSLVFERLLVIRATDQEGHTRWLAAPADQVRQVEILAGGGPGGKGGATVGGGKGGDGGRGGAGGALLIQYDSRHPELKGLVVGRTPGGVPGKGGDGSPEGAAGDPGPDGKAARVKGVSHSHLLRGSQLKPI